MLNRLRTWLTARYVSAQTLRVEDLRRARGIEAVEYVLIAAVIIVGVAILFGTLRGSLQSLLGDITNALGVGSSGS
jgi:Flp pilus assembly pilin Flp